MGFEDDNELPLSPLPSRYSGDGKRPPVVPDRELDEK